MWYHVVKRGLFDWLTTVKLDDFRVLSATSKDLSCMLLEWLESTLGTTAIKRTGIFGKGRDGTNFFLSFFPSSSYFFLLFHFLALVLRTKGRLERNFRSTVGLSTFRKHFRITAYIILVWTWSNSKSLTRKMTYLCLIPQR